MLPAVVSVVALGALTVPLGLSVPRPGPAAGDPTAVTRHERSGDARPPVTAAELKQCSALVTAGLRTDLVAMNSGLPVEGMSTDQLITSRWPLDSPERAKVRTAYDALLLTAASDLFGRYARDVRAEVIGYAPRIAAACD